MPDEGKSPEELLAELGRLRAENSELHKRAQGGLTFKVSTKGGVSVYGLGRFPVTLYKQQWQRLLESAGALSAFLQQNDGALTERKYGKT